MTSLAFKPELEASEVLVGGERGRRADGSFVFCAVDGPWPGRAEGGRAEVNAPEQPNTCGLEVHWQPSSYAQTAVAESLQSRVETGDGSLPTIRNTAKKPLNVPLPGGKRLFLGPGKEGEIRAKAAEHRPVVALLEAGDLEIVPDVGKSGGKGGGGGRTGGGQGRNPATSVFKSGDG